MWGGPPSFQPDEDELMMAADPAFDEDMDAFLAMEAEAEAEMAAEREKERAWMESQGVESQRSAGQSAPRRLDFASYGDLEGSFSGPAEPAATQSRFSSAITEEKQSQQSSRPLTHFQKERLQERKEALATRSSAPVVPSPSPSRAPSKSLSSAPSVLPPLHRSLSELRTDVLYGSARPRFVYRRAPVIGEFVTVTTERGERVYLTQETEEEYFKKVVSHRVLHRTQQMRRDLGQLDMRRMVRELEEEAHQADLACRARQVESRQYESDPEDDERTRLRKRRIRKERLLKRLVEAEEAEKRAERNRRLWVDKYAPKSYADLLSPEVINREVLQWIKSWDECVFGRSSNEMVMAAKHASAMMEADEGTEAALKNKDAMMLSNKMLSPSRKHAKKSTSSHLASDGSTDIRPAQKVILLCGPAGLGKTTLAHVLAKHAGYTPFEINASDDRTASVLEQKIRNAIEMQSVAFGVGQKARPHAVILDEIDGVNAEGGSGGSGSSDAIATLIQIIQAEGKRGGKKSKEDEEDEPGDGSDSDDEGPSTSKRKSKDGNDEQDGSSRRGKRAKKPTLPPLRRPIICICNDAYAPSLRPLRAIAKIVDFTAAPKNKFVDRLKYIVSNEGMQVESRVLAALAESVDFDIRSALNTLQFVHSKGHKMTAGLLNSMAIGRKDVEKSRFEVWDAVFCQRERKKDNLLVMRDMRETDQVNNRAAIQALSKTKELLGLLSDAGDLDKIMEGLFHNYPSVGYTDPSLYKTVEVAEWFSFAEIMQSKSGGSAGGGGGNESEQMATMASYVPFAALGVHLLTARPRRVKLEYPNMFYQQYVEQQRNYQILQSFLAPSSNILRRSGMTAHKVAVDILAPLLTIIHPPLRAVQVSLMTQKERHELNDLIDSMLSLALTYRPEVVTAFGSASTNVPAWKGGDAATTGAAGPNIIYKLEPSIDLVCVWSNPLDAATAKRFDHASTNNKFGGNNKFGKFGSQNATQPAFKIDKREMNMPNKVKQMVMRELEFESMRRAEARRSSGAEGVDGIASPSQNGSAATLPSSPATSRTPRSTLAPAVQRLKDAEKRKRDQAVAAASDVTSPPANSASSKSATGGEIDDESPATKRAKSANSRNFLAVHADAVKNKARARKTTLAAMKSEKEMKEGSSSATTTMNGSTSSSIAASSAAIPSRLAHPLHFRYNEGCTNAVRRTVNIAHFLPL